MLADTAGETRQARDHYAHQPTAEHDSLAVWTERPHLDWPEWRDSACIIRVYGVGLVYYRQYLYSLITLDAVLALLSLMPVIAHISTGSRSYSDQTLDTTGISDPLGSANSTNTGLGPYLFYLVTASYEPSAIPYVYAYLVLHLVLIVLHPLLYHRYLARHKPDTDLDLEDPFNVFSHEQQHEPHLDSDHKSEQLSEESSQEVAQAITQRSISPKGSLSPFEIQATRLIDYRESTKRSKSRGVTHTKSNDKSLHHFMELVQSLTWRRMVRNAMSMLCFGLILACYGVCIWAIQTYMYLYFHGKSNQYNLDVSVWISLFLALIQALTDILWMIVSELLQKIELHREQETANKWECMRLFALRLFSINMFYVIRIWILTSQEQCSAALLGVQHTLLVVSYLFADLMADYLVPWALRAYNRRQQIRLAELMLPTSSQAVVPTQAQQIVSRDYDLWYEYKLSEQYATVAYRHILLSSGSSFIPGLAWIALMGNVMQLYSDQYRLSTLVRVPHRLYSTYSYFLVILEVMTVLCFLLGYPKGVLFLFIDSNSFFTCDQLSTT